MVYHDAELRDWAVQRSEGFATLVGRVFGDKKRRWPDGRLIQSSPLLTPLAAREGNVVATLNSHYLLVGPRRSLRDALTQLVIFHLNDAQSIELARVFAEPPEPNKALRELGRSKPPWA
jgi:hypothetical protein